MIDGLIDDVDYIEQAIEYNAKDPSNYSLQSSIFISLKRPLQAIQSLKQAIQFQPHSHSLYQHLSSLYIQIGELNLAKSIDPDSLNQIQELESLVSLSRQLMITHQFEECIPILEKIRRIAPFWRSPFIDLVRCKVFLYRSKEAMDLLSTQCAWMNSLNESDKLITGLYDGWSREVDFDESVVYLSLLVLWQLNYQREMMKLYRVCKKYSVHDTLNDLLKLCEEFQRLDVEGMDRMRSNDRTGAIQALLKLHLLLSNFEKSGTPIGKSVDNAVLLNKGLIEQIEGNFKDAKGEASR